MHLQINRKSEHVVLLPIHETRYKTNFKCRIESNEQNTNIMYFFMCNDFRRGVIVPFVDISGIVDHRCLNVLFCVIIIYSRTKRYSFCYSQADQTAACYSIVLRIETKYKIHRTKSTFTHLFGQHFLPESLS